MMYRIFFCSLFCSLALLSAVSWKLPDRIYKKVAKEVRTTFKTDTFELSPVHIPSDLSKEMKGGIAPETLFSIHKEEKLLGYAYIATALSKTDTYEYLVLLDTRLIIAKTKVLIYREDYGSEIGSKRWLKQFIGKSYKNTLTYQKDIIAISGATISASSMTMAINTFLRNVVILHNNHIL